MIHAVTSANQHLYARQLDQMFRMRHAYYIEGHGWAGLSSQEGRETDEFDDLDAVYLLSIDPAGEVAASVRLNPTSGPTLLGKFSDWADETLPSGPSVWDISRWIAQPQHRRSDNSRWPSNHQRELMVGILEFCLSRGLTHLTMLAELRLAERIAAYGWPLRHLGAPREYEGGKGVAVGAEIQVGHHVLTLTRQKTGVFGEVLFEIDPSRLPAPATRPPTASEDLQSIVRELGAASVNRLFRTLARDLAGAEHADRPQAIELLAAVNRLLEAAGVGLEDEPRTLGFVRPREGATPVRGLTP